MLYVFGMCSYTEIACMYVYVYFNSNSNAVKINTAPGPKIHILRQYKRHLFFFQSASCFSSGGMRNYLVRWHFNPRLMCRKTNEKRVEWSQAHAKKNKRSKAQILVSSYKAYKVNSHGLAKIIFCGQRHTGTTTHAQWLHVAIMGMCLEWCLQASTLKLMM